MSGYIVICDEETASWIGNDVDSMKRLVRCVDCKHSRKDGTLCMFFASWEPIAGGDEYAEMPADVEPDGFCAWAEKPHAGKRRNQS